MNEIDRYNKNVIFYFPTISFLEDLKNMVFDELTYIESKINRICENVFEDSEKDQRLLNIISFVVLAIIASWILRRFGRFFERTTKKNQTRQIIQLRAELQKIRTELDSTRKQLVSNKQDQPNGSSNGLTKVQQKVFESLEQNDKIIKMYSECIEKSNKFNQIFLTLLKDIFSELKCLKKTKLTSASKISKINGTRSAKSVITDNNTHSYVRQETKLFSQIEQSKISTVVEQKKLIQISTYTPLLNSTQSQPAAQNHKFQYPSIQSQIIKESEEFKQQEAFSLMDTIQPIVINPSKTIQPQINIKQNTPFKSVEQYKQQQIIQIRPVQPIPRVRLPPPPSGIKRPPPPPRR